MPADQGSVLDRQQEERLLELRAAWEEGEDEERWDRLRQREEDRETLAAIARLLTESRFMQGSDLTYSQMARFLTLVRSLAPNPNLDSRLLRQPDEPNALNRDLHALLVGDSGIPIRLRGFLSRRSAGTQTAMQILCAVYPDQWPLVSPHVLNALELTAEQRSASIAMARERFGLPEEVVEAGSVGGKRVRTGFPNSDPVLNLLADGIVLETIREILEMQDYVEVYRLLSRRSPHRSARIRKRSAPIFHAPPQATGRQSVLVREQDEEGYTPQMPRPIAVPPDISNVSELDLLLYIERFVAMQGFTYPSHVLRDYYVSLQTKPFALLAGLSGTGKSRLTSLFAEALTGAAETQYRLLPVRPDWSDSTPLLGYVNLLAGHGEGRFVSTAFLEFLRRADRLESANLAFFVCLDEMNLARVEHYFAEVLSAMESPSREILLPGSYLARLPANLFITGTLNLDETTHSVSRKVLDRANVLTFQDVFLENEETTADSGEYTGLTPEVRQALFLFHRVTTVSAARNRLRSLDRTGTDYAGKIVRQLAEANALLEAHRLHFGYRVRDEILRYCANSFDRNGQGLLLPDASSAIERNLDLALDLQFVQKVLPRLTGTREQVETPIRDLKHWSEHHGYRESALRLSRLLEQVIREGFVSFDMA